MANKPDLSQIASNSWGDNFDVDSIIANENKAMEAAAQNLPTSTPTMSTGGGLQVNTPQHIQSQPQTTPTVHQPREPEKDHWKDAHEETLEVQPSALDPDFQDSGTKTSQQNLNQQSPQLPHDMQQESEDSSQFYDSDPYLLAFSILQEFDMIRLPENVDYDKLDLDTLAMYKDETLQMQRNEALDYVRGQVIHDPLALQLFDYAYYGQGFADIPKMQGILKETFDYANYNITSERAQKAIVKLYHADGLNPRDNRDNAILRDIPNKINKLAEDLKLKKEAENANRFFIQRSQEKATAEENNLLALIQQQDQIEAQRQQMHEMWNADFIEALSRRAWSEGKKTSVARETSYVPLNNGEQIPLWQYKQEIIFDNPALFQMFLDFTSKFDIETGTFRDEEVEVLPQSTLNQIIKRLQNKSNTSKSTVGSRNPQVGTQAKQPRVTDVNRNWFM